MICLLVFDSSSMESIAVTKWNFHRMTALSGIVAHVSLSFSYPLHHARSSSLSVYVNIYSKDTTFDRFKSGGSMLTGLIRGNS